MRGNLEYPGNGLDALTVGKKQIGDDCRYTSRASHAQPLLSLRAFSHPLDDELRIARSKKSLLHDGSARAIALN
jgi:hypothetical protein